MFIAIKTEDGRNKGKIAFYCKALGVTRQGFYHYLKTKDLPWKYQALADAMIDICAEDECNDTYGRIRMYQALQLKQPEGVHIPGERTVYRVMEEIGLNHKPKRKPNGITKADKEGIPDFRVPEGIDERALKILGCNCKDVRIICGGRGKGKMMAAEEWLKTLPKEVREKAIVVKASDPVPELKGNKLPRIVDCDLMETTEFTWELWERIKLAIKK